MMARRVPELSEHYGVLLAAYLVRPDEAHRSAGYEFGREALDAGRGVLDVAQAHQAALHELSRSVMLDADDLHAAGAFLVECLSPFELNHRCARDGNDALRRLNESLENEVRRIAHALHDEAGQLLASVHIALADVSTALPEPARPRLEQVSWLLTRIESELRHLAHELHPTVLDDFGLEAALEQLADAIERRHGLVVRVQTRLRERLPPPIEVVLYRTVQEALNNVVRHAQAHHVDILLSRTADGVTCSVRDDGVGLHPGPLPASGLGLLAMRERLAAIGGALQLDSTPRHGTTLRAAVQLAGGVR
jgi:signal transduction histidine kinase